MTEGITTVDYLKDEILMNGFTALFTLMLLRYEPGMLPYLHVALLLLIESWKLKNPNTQHAEDENHGEIIGQSPNESLASVPV